MSIEPSQESQAFVERATQCLSALDAARADSPTDNRKLLIELWRLVSDMVPSRQELYTLRTHLMESNRRRRIAESRVEELRDGVERLLCDCPGKSATLRELERMLRESSSECD